MFKRKSKDLPRDVFNIVVALVPTLVATIKEKHRYVTLEQDALVVYCCIVTGDTRTNANFVSLPRFSASYVVDTKQIPSLVYLTPNAYADSTVKATILRLHEEACNLTELAFLRRSDTQIVMRDSPQLIPSHINAYPGGCISKCGSVVVGVRGFSPVHKAYADPNHVFAEVLVTLLSANLKLAYAQLRD